MISRWTPKIAQIIVQLSKIAIAYKSKLNFQLASKSNVQN